MDGVAGTVYVCMHARPIHELRTNTLCMTWQAWFTCAYLRGAGRGAGGGGARLGGGARGGQLADRRLGLNAWQTMLAMSFNAFRTLVRSEEEESRLTWQAISGRPRLGRGGSGG